MAYELGSGSWKNDRPTSSEPGRAPVSIFTESSYHGPHDKTPHDCNGYCCHNFQKAEAEAEARKSTFQVLKPIVQSASTSVGLYRDEEVASNYGYPKRYKPKPIAEQVMILQYFWPQLRLGKNISLFEKKEKSLAGPGAYFALVRWQALGIMYNEVLVKDVLEALKAQRPFINYVDVHRLGPQHLFQIEETKVLIDRFADQQNNSDIIILPAQFGLNHPGRSQRRSHAMFRQGEFGLGALHAGTMLLTHPERLDADNALWISCPGDVQDEQYPFFTPCFSFDDSSVQFSLNRYDWADARLGSVTGFVS